MPSYKEFPNVSSQIIRYRCYACSKPWWETFATAQRSMQTTNNTVVALCDDCEEKFNKEGRFW